MVSPIPTGATHASRQAFARTLDFAEVARNDDQIDRALQQATAAVEGYLHRGFYPWYGTRSVDWPSRDNPVSWRLRLNDNELISLTSATAGGVTLTPPDILLYPNDGPPYTWLETTAASNSVFQAGDTWQNAVAITGKFGYRDQTYDVGTLNGGINSSVTTLTVSDSSAIGVGDVLLLDSEYVVVRDVQTASTGQTLQSPLSALNSGTSVAVTTGSAFSVGEQVTLDSEQMLVLDIAGNTLIVKRAWNGTVLAAHTGSTIYAPRSVVVDRAACGSTAASHSNGITVKRHVIPPPVVMLTLAEAGWIYAGHSSGWLTAPGTTNRSTATLAALEVLKDLRKNAMRAVGRKARLRTV